MYERLCCALFSVCGHKSYASRSVLWEYILYSGVAPNGVLAMSGASLIHVTNDKVGVQITSGSSDALMSAHNMHVEAAHCLHTWRHSIYMFSFESALWSACQ